MGARRHYRHYRRRLAPILAAALLSFVVPGEVTARTTLPIEVVGQNGTMASAAVDVPAQQAREVRSLWIEIHNLTYAGMVSVQVNASPWLPLNNNTVDVAEPGKSFGGIGGAFATLKVILPLPANTVADGVNTIRFRFDSSNGSASGFRVLAFNLLTADARKVLAPDSFAADDPAAWTPPLPDPDSIRAGREHWQHAPLMASDLPGAASIRAHCADCHAHDGRDLKYFSFSNTSIIARSRFHGLSELQGRQIASYIRSLRVPNPGRPWDPPYQPGPGLDSRPVTDWAAGAGLSWVLQDDAATLPFLLAAKTPPVSVSSGAAPDWTSMLPLISRGVFRPDGNLNPREVPISLQLPDWNHWLPSVHPMDAWGAAFDRSEFSESYSSAKSSLRSVLASSDLSSLISSGRLVTSFDKWRSARRAFLKPYVERASVSWTPELSQKAYSTELWQLVKTWEVTQEFGLEERGREWFGASGEPRTWLNTIPAATAPAAVNIPDGPAGMGGSPLTNQYFNASWYELQLLLNSGNHRHRDRTPVDWVYFIGQFLDLFRETHRPEPARLLVAVIKAMQSTDPRIGPEDPVQGWNPGHSVDPTIMVSEIWAPIFQPLSGDVRRALTDSLLDAWLDKNAQFPLGRYFTPGVSQSSYAAPASLGGIMGGKVWEQAPAFRAAGVRPETLKQLEKWGSAYTDMAARFQYSTGSNRSRGSSGKKTTAR